MEPFPVDIRHVYVLGIYHITLARALDRAGRDIIQRHAALRALVLMLHLFPVLQNRPMHDTRIEQPARDAILVHDQAHGIGPGNSDFQQFLGHRIGYGLVKVIERVQPPRIVRDMQVIREPFADLPIVLVVPIHAVLPFHEYLFLRRVRAYALGRLNSANRIVAIVLRLLILDTAQRALAQELGLQDRELAIMLHHQIIHTSLKNFYRSYWI